ncbi:MAG: hypothetical protein EZS28_055002, partial [Streblomastix strix]
KNFEVKLADFGLSRAFKDGKSVVDMIGGTYPYLAPELLKALKNNGFEILKKEFKIPQQMSGHVASFFMNSQNIFIRFYQTIILLIIQQKMKFQNFQKVFLNH